MDAVVAKPILSQPAMASAMRVSAGRKVTAKLQQPPQYTQPMHCAHESSPGASSEVGEELAERADTGESAAITVCAALSNTQARESCETSRATNTSIPRNAECRRKRLNSEADVP